MQKKNKVLDFVPPEFSSIESFVQFLIDDERTVYSHEELQQLAFYTRAKSTRELHLSLDDIGLTLKKREHEKRVRGFTTSSNDRWYGPGSCPTHGGSGFSNKE